MWDNVADGIMWGLLGYIAMFAIFWIAMLVFLMICSPMGMSVLSGH